MGWRGGSKRSEREKGEEREMRADPRRADWTASAGEVERRGTEEGEEEEEEHRIREAVAAACVSGSPD